MNKKNTILTYNLGSCTIFAYYGCKFFILTSLRLKGFFNNWDIKPTTLETSLTKWICCMLWYNENRSSLLASKLMTVITHSLNCNKGI